MRERQHIPRNHASKEAELAAMCLGLLFAGHQEEIKGPGYWLMSDPLTKSTIAVPVDSLNLREAAYQHLKESRQRFENALKTHSMRRRGRYDH